MFKTAKIQLVTYAFIIQGRLKFYLLSLIKTGSSIFTSLNTTPDLAYNKEPIINTQALG